MKIWTHDDVHQILINVVDLDPGKNQSNVDGTRIFIGGPLNWEVPLHIELDTRNSFNRNEHVGYKPYHKVDSDT